MRQTQKSIETVRELIQRLNCARGPEGTMGASIWIDCLVGSHPGTVALIGAAT